MTAETAVVPPCSEPAELELAIRAARAAGEVQLRCRRREPVVERFFAHDLKLEVDRLSEAAVVETIRAARPEAALLAEEGGESPGSGDLQWIVDPLDGTMNYYHGQHHFCSCVACYRRPAGSSPDPTSLGEPVAGAVYAAAYGELFSGTPRAASCNDRPLRVSDVASLDEALVAVSLGSREETLKHMIGVLPRLARRTRKLRMQGSCGLDICGVAAGRLSALYQRDVRCWDFAAAAVVLAAAGGRLEAVPTGGGRWNVLAAAPGIFSELRELLQET